LCALLLQRIQPFFVSNLRAQLKAPDQLQICEKITARNAACVRAVRTRLNSAADLVNIAADRLRARQQQRINKLSVLRQQRGKARGEPSLIFQVQFELCLSAAAAQQQTRVASATFL